MKGNAERRGDVAHRVEGAVVRHDLEYVARARPGEPHTRAHGDPEIAPVADAGGWRAVEELGAESGEHAPRLVTDHAPVADGDEFSARGQAIDGQVLDDARDVLGAARVLDVEEDGATLVGMRARGGRRWNARGEAALGQRERDLGLVLGLFGG